MVAKKSQRRRCPTSSRASDLSPAMPLNRCCVVSYARMHICILCVCVCVCSHTNEWSEFLQRMCEVRLHKREDYLSCRNLLYAYLCAYVCICVFKYVHVWDANVWHAPHTLPLDHHIILCLLMVTIKANSSQRLRLIYWCTCTHGRAFTSPSWRWSTTGDTEFSQPRAFQASQTPATWWTSTSAQKNSACTRLILMRWLFLDSNMLFVFVLQSCWCCEKFYRFCSLVILVTGMRALSGNELRGNDCVYELKSAFHGIWNHPARWFRILFYVIMRIHKYPFAYMSVFVSTNTVTSIDVYSCTKPQTARAFIPALMLVYVPQTYI